MNNEHSKGKECSANAPRGPGAGCGAKRDYMLFLYLPAKEAESSAKETGLFEKGTDWIVPFAKETLSFANGKRTMPSAGGNPEGKCFPSRRE